MQRVRDIGLDLGDNWGFAGNIENAIRFPIFFETGHLALKRGKVEFEHFDEFILSIGVLHRLLP
jgi:hypothetical protein